MTGGLPLAPGLEGFAISFGLIVAIGAQNAFILRQGLMREHVFALCLVASLSDALLVALGVAGVGTFVASNATLFTVMTLGGAVFLTVYGAMAARRALSPSALVAGRCEGLSLRAALATLLALTFLNPHVYVDTLLLVGSLSARFEGAGRLAFGIGATSASFVWFFLLGYGARLLAPLFARPAAWRVLDAIIALIMWSIALSLLMPLLSGA